MSRISLYLTEYINVLIYIEAFSGDTLLANGGQRRKSENGTFNVDIERHFAEIADILEDDGQIASPLTDKANQSSMKKVSDTVSNRPRCFLMDSITFAIYFFLALFNIFQSECSDCHISQPKHEKLKYYINN